MVNNVKFSITVPTYSTAHKRWIMGTEPAIQHIPGRFAEMQTTLESEILSGGESDRFVHYRLIFQRTQALDSLSKTGAIITITHTLHRLTNSWVVEQSPKQYIVHSDTDVLAVGDTVNLGLIRKDQQ